MSDGIVTPNRSVQPVHHGQHMNSSLANQLSTIPQQNVMVPTIKPTVMVNPYEAGANNYMPQKFCFQPPSRPKNMNGIGMRGEVNYKIKRKKRIKILANVPVETFPPAFISQLVDKQHHYQQMTNNSSFNSYGPQQAEAYHNFLIPTMPNPQMQAVSEYQSPRSSTSSSAIQTGLLKALETKVRNPPILVLMPRAAGRKTTHTTDQQL
ncbi:hypothetical protein CK203_022601 [Vitis vinifera]|uniref:Uncharacterized protein n=1 Tax=Vitis vinifera TaxID=29760 RepID=A0A438JE88_VITVI|nr:hypothetical protein CK203_022601 [Vitis vinifera]